MRQINVEDLKSHPRNKEFFDNITGDAWDQFLDSIKTSGIIEPIVATQDLVIVSGHQRVRAARNLGMTKVMVDVREYDDDDQVLKDLIESNIRQRGIGNSNPVKWGKCLKELERIYGIQNGGNHGNQYKMAEPKLSVLAKTQKDLANELGVSVDSLQKYKKLAELIPELEKLLDTNKIAPTTAIFIVDHLSEEEQKEFVQSTDVAKKITRKQVQKYIDRHNDMKNKSQGSSEYDLTKRCQNIQSESERLKKELQDKYSELEALREEIDEFLAVSNESWNIAMTEASAEFFCLDANNFIDTLGTIAYILLIDFYQISEVHKEEIIKTVDRNKSFWVAVDHDIKRRI